VIFVLSLVNVRAVVVVVFVPSMGVGSLGGCVRTRLRDRGVSVRRCLGFPWWSRPSGRGSRARRGGEAPWRMRNLALASLHLLLTGRYGSSRRGPGIGFRRRVPDTLVVWMLAHRLCVGTAPYYSIRSLILCGTIRASGLEENDGAVVRERSGCSQAWAVYPASSTICSQWLQVIPSTLIV